MRQAADAMSLTAPDMKPWHLRARVKRFMPDGVVRETEIEQWCASPDRYKVTSISGEDTRTEYHAAGNSVFTGSMSIVTPSMSALIHPLPFPVAFSQVTFAEKDVNIQSIPLQCYLEGAKDRVRKLTYASSFCFSPST